MEKLNTSVIIPVYNEEESTKELFSKIKSALDGLQKTYEVIYVDDGSDDKTFDVLKDLALENRQLKVISFKRNFGKSAALAAGFEAANGEVVFTMDGDLQYDPAEIPAFLAKMQEGYDLVVGWQADKYRKMIKKKIASKIFNKLTYLLTGVKIHDSNCCFKAFKYEVVKSLKVHGELHRYIPALAYWQGYKIAEIKIGYYPRKYGKSKYYGLGRIFKGFLDLITVKFLMAYLTKPIHFFGQMGIFMLFAGFLFGVATILYKFVFNFPLQSSQLPLLTVFFIVIGIQFILMGLLAEILIRIYYEPRGNLPYAVKDKINFE